MGNKWYINFGNQSPYQLFLPIFLAILVFFLLFILGLERPRKFLWGTIIGLSTILGFLGKFNPQIIKIIAHEFSVLEGFQLALVYFLSTLFLGYISWYGFAPNRFIPDKQNQSVI